MVNDHQIEMEVQAFKELKRLGLYHPERKFNDKEIQQRRYTKELRAHQRRTGMQPPPAASSQQALDQLRDYAADLIEENTSHSDRIL